MNNENISQQKYAAAMEDREYFKNQIKEAELDIAYHLKSIKKQKALINYYNQELSEALAIVDKVHKGINGIKEGASE